jgi:hypothetical protein
LLNYSYQFGLTGSIGFGLNIIQKGEIFDVRLWPFTTSIIIFSLIVDKTGNETTMIYPGLIYMRLSYSQGEYIMSHGVKMNPAIIGLGFDTACLVKTDENSFLAKL